MNSNIFTNQLLLCGLALICAVGCKKDFLDDKPNSNIVIPTTLEDMTKLLDNPNPFVYTSPALSFLNADEYYIPDLSAFNALNTKTERNSYLWNKEIYDGETNIADWNSPYNGIFYANVILEQWEQLSSNDKVSEQGKTIRASALFIRANNLYNLIQVFTRPYDKATATTDLGIPIRLTANINNIQPRANLQQSYDQVIEDLNNAVNLFSKTFPAKNSNRPSKAAAYALMARIYLNMREYKNANENAEKSLGLRDILIDYNSLDTSTNIPLTIYNEELLNFTMTNLNYGSLLVGVGSTLINTDLIRLYDDHDLRKMIYFRVVNNQYQMKTAYAGYNYYPFTGLATDEVYLIKAECLAREGKLNDAITTLNQLLVKRFMKGRFTPYSSTDQQAVIDKILEERRKELVWRGIRWQDLKRLNKEGANIVLTRILEGKTYKLQPNDPKYVMPIPEDEISFSHIQQNIR